MITSLRLQNFKAHRDTTVPLGRFTVLVGPNGSGKTSVLQALLALTAMLESPDTSDFQTQTGLSPEDIEHRASGGSAILLTAEGIRVKHAWAVSIAVSRRTVDAASRVPKGWSTRVRWAEGEDALAEVRGERPLLERQAASPPPDGIGQAVLYHFDVATIAAASYSRDVQPVVEPNGSNTAAVLAAIKLEQDEMFDRIEDELRRIVPQVERVRVRRVKVRHRPEDGSQQEVVGHKIYLDFRGAPDVPAHGASEGTLVTLALLTALCGPQRPSVLLLDDIDQSLHPQAQADLVRELKRLLDEFPDVQIVATTHSPFILDELDPADIVVLAPRNDGSIAAKRLSDHPEAARMKGALSSGQLWSLDPEKAWVASEGS